MSSSSPVIVDRTIVDVDYVGHDVVELCCCGELIMPVIWDPAANAVIVSISHASAAWSKASRDGRPGLARAKFECSRCGRAPVVRAEKLVPIIGNLVRHSVSQLTLTGLESILVR